MPLRLLCMLLLSCLIPSACWAIKLYVWQSSPGTPKIILPRTDNESTLSALNRYKKNLGNPALDSLVPNNFNIPTGRIYDLPAETSSGAVRMAMIANWFTDMTAEGTRIQNNARLFTRSGSDVYVIGLAADMGLNAKDSIDYREAVAKNFSLLVSLGGDDISPELFGEKSTFARNTNITRDHSELALVKTFKKFGKGIFFGICRGHQMGAVADGHKLHQDLSETGAGKTEHHFNKNGANTTEKQTWHHLLVQDSLLKRFLRGQTKTLVNSLHHQAVNVQERASSFAIAFDDRDGIVEALQARNNKSLSVQFHPEFPVEVSGNVEFSKMGSSLIQNVVNYARLNRIRHSPTATSCKKIY